MSTTSARFSKFVRPEAPRNGVITERDLDIVEVILRYRFSPTSEMVRLVGGNEKVTLRRLRQLWEWGYVNRFAFPGIRNHSEFSYYLDTTKSLDLLLQHGRAAEIHPHMEEEIKLNREADYAGAVMRGQHMKLGFLQHSLMVSRMHFMLEMSSRNPANGISFAAWRQGAELRGHKAEVPEIHSRRIEGTNKYAWEERDNHMQKLPVEPDALFSLGLAGDRLSHFCYEADRGTMSAADMLKKFRAYYHFVKRQQKHREAFGVHPIRAVLIETTAEPRARKLMELVEQVAVIGESSQSGLFWFCISPLFGASLEAGDMPSTSRYLTEPQSILQPVWALPDFTLHSLQDAENQT
ncbi:MAG TPA: replication-relaxation family protein [Bryobacteraceae bacterium]|nr:replication-relaxation family protein [Bryobacteraceae bacterium]